MYRKELLNEIHQHKEALGNAQKSYLEKIDSLQSQNEQEKDTLNTQLRYQHSQEMLSLQHANQLAVDALKERIESEAKHSMALAHDDHVEEMRVLEEKLGKQFSEGMARVQTDHLTEIERFRQQIGSVVSQSQKQVIESHSQPSSPHWNGSDVTVVFVLHNDPFPPEPYESVHIVFLLRKFFHA